MATAKITLTLEQDEERGTNEAMEETVQILATLDIMPLMKLVLTLECEEVSAERYRDVLRRALREQPIGIVAKFKTTTEEEVTRVLMPPVTPMDQLLRNGGTITLGREHFDALQQAGAQLREMGGAQPSGVEDDLFVNNDEGLEDRDGNRRPMTATERQAWNERA